MLPTKTNRAKRAWLALALGAIALSLPACEGGGNFTVFGYSTQPNYNTNIHTVYVPIFENRTFYRGLEFALTQEVIKDIEAKTPFKVTSNCPETSDTELKGTIVAVSKGILNRNNLNEVREAEMSITVQVVWRDRRTGEILSAPAPLPLSDALPPVPKTMDIPGTNMLGLQAPLVPPTKPSPLAVNALGTNTNPNQPSATADGNAPANGKLPVDTSDPNAPRPVPPALITGSSTFIPELGGSITTAEAKAVAHVAIQIISMMEEPW